MDQGDQFLGGMATHKGLGDLTANATVEWVLLKLSSANSLAEVVSALPEDLCEALNTTRLIDRLREQICKEDSIFESIECIAEELERGEWQSYPRLSILLLSIAKDYLTKRLKNNEARKKTNLYCAGERIYHHFMEQPDSYDRCVFVLKAGFQLFHYERDRLWHREFEEFQTLYEKVLLELQMYYYFGDNFAELSDQATTERGSKRIRESVFQARGKGTDQEVRHLVALNPQRLEFPILIRSPEALEFASHFTQNLYLGNNAVEKNVEEMAQKFRILQWEIVVRNLVEEHKDREFCFYPTTVNYNIQGRPKKDFLISFIDRVRKVECHFIPREEQILVEESNEAKILNKKISESYESLKCLLSKVPHSIYEDYVHSFVNIRNGDSFLNVMLIRDGELSFFSLLWLLRYAYHMAKKDREDWEFNLKVWKSNLNKKLTVRFRPRSRVDGEEPIPSDWTPSEVDWSPCNIIEFAEECGWIIRLSNEKCLPTCRWRSFITWLKWLNTNLNLKDLEKNLKDLEKKGEKCKRKFKKKKEEYEKYKEDLEVLQAGKILSYNNSLLQRLQLKRLNYNENVELSFIKELWELLASDNLKSLLKGLDKEAVISCEEFANERLGPLLEFLDPLLKVESSAGLEDVLLHCCRGFIPLEHLSRAYQPYETHLLVQALNWEKSFLVENKPAPISLGFTAIAGWVPPEDSSDSKSSENVPPAFYHWLVPFQGLLSTLSSDSESSENVPLDFRFNQWLVPYRSLFSALSADIVLPAVQESSGQVGVQIGTQDQQKRFAHQTAGLLDVLWLDGKKNELNAESKIALWLARTQVAEVWGGFPLNTETHICKDFPEWKRLRKIDIIDKLIDLGLHGGIMRAGKSEIEEIQERAWEFGWKLRDDDPKVVEQTFHEIRSDLSFPCLPDSPLPEWVTTKAFAICFFHGVRQAAYHALKKQINDKQAGIYDKQAGICYLSINWDNQSVAIYNRGVIEPGHRNGEIVPKDCGFFKTFVDRTDDYRRVTDISEKFEIDGPKPVATSDDEWQLVIKKE